MTQKRDIHQTCTSKEVIHVSGLKGSGWLLPVKAVSFVVESKETRLAFVPLCRLISTIGDSAIISECDRDNNVHVVPTQSDAHESTNVSASMHAMTIKLPDFCQRNPQLWLMSSFL